MHDKESARRVLSINRHKFYGRTIIVSPYLRGDNLKDTRRLDNRWRIIVKRCPPGSTETDLEELFAKFGEVKLAYFFRQDATSKSRGSSSKNSKVAFKTASVFFSDFHCAEEVLQSSQPIILRGCKLRIEPYQHDRSKVSNPKAGGSSPHS